MARGSPLATAVARRSTNATRSACSAWRTRSSWRSRNVGSMSSAASKARARKRAPPRCSAAAEAGSPARRSRGGRPRLGWLTAASLPCDLGRRRRRYDGPMAGTEPGERPPDPTSRPQRQLERPPGERYAAHRASEGAGRAGALGPVLWATLAALFGSMGLFAVGGLIASTGGLLFVAGVTGAVVGLLLARAAAPAEGGAPALSRPQVTWLAVELSLG